MALAARKSKRPPTHYHSEYVDIDIDPEDLERAGWKYVGKDGDEGEAMPERKALDIVRDWHNETHEGPWQWCPEQPCDTLRGRPHDGWSDDRV